MQSTKQSNTAVATTGRTGTFCGSPTPGGDGPWGELFAWITHGTMPYWDDKNFPLIRSYEEAKTATTFKLYSLIRDDRLSWEMVPSEMLTTFKA